MENQQETSVNEVDSYGGWLVTHHTQTWDTRVRLDSIEGQAAEARAKADAAVAEASSTPTSVVLDFASALTTQNIGVICQISNNFAW